MNEMVKDYLAHHGILGQKWGVRRYQNKDGTLTAAGKKRYDRDVQENLSKKKDNRIDTSRPDPNRWVKEDLNRQQNVINNSSNIIKQLSNIEKTTQPKQTVKKMDLSQMSDKDLRDRINRELLEQQYNKLFAEADSGEISKGRKFTQNFLDSAGTVLTLASSVVGIALAVKELKG